MQIVRKPSTPRSGSVIDALASISEPELRATVERLAAPRHRLAQPAANRRAARFVADRLEAAGYAVELEGELDNVVALPRLRAPEGGAPPPRLILIGAHYDSVPGTPGADDDASGVAALLAAAHALSRWDDVPVGFVAWNGEEDGLLGSIDFVARRAAAGARDTIAAVHVLEMVGYATRAPGSQRMPVPHPGAPDVGDFIGLLGNRSSNRLVDLAARQAEACTPELPVVGLKVYLGLERWLPVLHRSDHAPFWQAGIPALMWTDTAEFRNPNYHRATDTPDTLDYTFLRRVAQLVTATALCQAAELAS